MFYEWAGSTVMRVFENIKIDQLVLLQLMVYLARTILNMSKQEDDYILLGENIQKVVQTTFFHKRRLIFFNKIKYVYKI